MPPPEVFLSARFRRSLRALGHEDYLRTERTLQAIALHFGQPHEHAGLSIRKLAPSYFECRVGLQLRLVFRAAPGRLGFILAGNHDDVRHVLREI